MSVEQLAQRYAKAQLSAANDKKVMQDVSADCNSLLAMLKTSPDFVKFIESTSISKEVRAETIIKIATEAKLNDVTVSMLSVLAYNNRLSLLPLVLQSAKSMINDITGLSDAKVTSAVILEEPQIEEIRAQLKKKLGHDVTLETHVDPSIIGGLVVRVGSMMVDDSVKTKLDRMVRRLTDEATV
jgi:F-type H+-transporting ATPase subunit delta